MLASGAGTGFRAVDVLVIDDDLEASAEVSAMLARASLTSICVPNGQAALDVLETGCRPAVALVDLRMPTMGGLAFARRLSQLDSRSRPELVFFSGSASFKDATEALRLGARDMVNKPVDGRRLVQAIKDAKLKYQQHQPVDDLNPADEISGSEIDPGMGIADPTWVRTVIGRLRAIGQARAKHLPCELFADPCWDMLLDLYHCAITNSEATITSLGAASGVPLTTALRRIAELEELGLVARSRDSKDKRRIVMTLTEQGFKAIEDFLLDIAKHQCVPLRADRPGTGHHTAHSAIV